MSGDGCSISKKTKDCNSTWHSPHKSYNGDNEEVWQEKNSNENDETYEECYPVQVFRIRNKKIRRDFLWFVSDIHNVQSCSGQTERLLQN